MHDDFMHMARSPARCHAMPSTGDNQHWHWRSIETYTNVQSIWKLPRILLLVGGDEQSIQSHCSRRLPPITVPQFDDCYQFDGDANCTCERNAIWNARIENLIELLAPVWLALIHSFFNKIIYRNGDKIWMALLERKYVRHYIVSTNHSCPFAVEWVQWKREHQWHELHLANGRRHRVQLSYYELNSARNAERSTGRNVADWHRTGDTIVLKCTTTAFPFIFILWQQQSGRGTFCSTTVSTRRMRIRWPCCDYGKLRFYANESRRMNAIHWVWDDANNVPLFSLRQWNGIEIFCSKNFLRIRNSQSQCIRLNILI